MKIEIAEPGRMTQSGSSLLRLIQNNKTPVLDLLVRESIQNSLDAHKDGARSVTVQFKTGYFNSQKLGHELEGIETALADRFSNGRCQYLAVQDWDTVGLTGEMDVKKVHGNNYGNLLKLVYEICKPQEAAGAGGSWGLGKTIYFRIGIGLVVYYSRIENEQGGYSSRLAASFVEDEAKEDAMIPEYNGLTRRGIAWWGDSIRENTTVPVTDEQYIKQFLDIFGIEPYTGDKTGTSIIIPYINSGLLLENNRIDYSDELDDHYSPFWYSSLESYLKISVQRWYAPRLANNRYPFGAFLKAMVNGDGISYDSMEPIFKAVQALYNRANHVNEDDFLSDNKAETAVESANVRKFLTDTTAGNIACTKLTREVLQMQAPYNKPEPAVYFNCEVSDKTRNSPVVFFVRKPGMIVSYETVSAWTAGISPSGSNEYILGIFVLHSENKFRVDDSPVEDLEEYVRKSEMADHTSWNDWTDSQFNPRIISKIQKSVTKTIGNQYAADSSGYQPKENSELSRYIGDMILPPDGFGSAPSNPPKPPSNTPPQKQKKLSFVACSSEVTYRANTMTVPLELNVPTKKEIGRISFEMQIDSESGKITLQEWENKLNLQAPFSIDSVSISVVAADGSKNGSLLSVTPANPTAAFQDVGFELKRTDAGSCYRLDITSKTEHSMKVRFNTVVKLAQKNVRPVFVFDKEGR